jgi:glycosyltransferase involved in cell wall biosynthesis
MQRIAHAVRYRRAGLAGTVRRIGPDVFHAHYLVEHGFYGATAGIHPYVVTAWGSDVLVEPERDPLSRWIAKWTIRHADLLTSNNGYMADRIVALGAPRAKVQVVTLGADRFFLERWPDSINVRGRVGGPRIVLSTRAHEPLYNIGEIISAYGDVAHRDEGVRLVIAHTGSATPALMRQAAKTPGDVRFTGTLVREAFREILTDAEVFVSVPSSDGTSVALLQAMASGCFPVVSDLPTQHELIDDGVNGFRVPLHRPPALAGAITRALADDDLRRSAAEVNRRIVEQRGLNETQMLRMEELYLGLCRER